MHALPPRELACVVLPTSASSTACGNRRRTSSAPLYGVAPSSVVLTSSASGVSAPVTFTGVPWGAAQVMHGVLNQTLPQVSNGATAAVAKPSARHLANSRGQAESTHWTARYIA